MKAKRIPESSAYSGARAVKAAVATDATPAVSEPSELTRVTTRTSP
jgi:hypothetical protein